MEPRNYLEIGVNDGRSLALSRVPSIAVDPEFRVTVPIRCDLDLVRATSDDFFALPDPLAHFRGRGDPAVSSPESGGLPSGRGDPTIDLAFIDGMHLVEFALRDRMNVERHAEWWSVIVFDDMLPRSVDEAARDRHTRDWAGDVYKLIAVLVRHRPDLTLIRVNTAPTGVLVVLAADPANTALRDRYDEILAEWVVPDPQLVPQEILERAGAVEPEALLSFAAVGSRSSGRGAGASPRRVGGSACARWRRRSRASPASIGRAAERRRDWADADRVTVVVPVYNPGPYLDRCVASILAQTLPAEQLEVLFVDDGSTDDAPARLLRPGARARRSIRRAPAPVRRALRRARRLTRR